MLFQICLLFLFFSLISAVSVQDWEFYIEDIHNQAGERFLKPLPAVADLTTKYLWQNNSSSPVLDIGCELGKNAICLVQAGHDVVIMDIAQNAIDYTKENLEKLQLEHGIAGSICGAIEDLDPAYGPFKAVVGTYVFSFIQRENFENVMEKNVLQRIEPGGYFAGGFFGKEHAWANKPYLTILSKEELEDLLHSKGFAVSEINEIKEDRMTATQGLQFFHIFEVIAQRIY